MELISIRVNNHSTLMSKYGHLWLKPSDTSQNAHTDASVPI